jgi:hypothetical protein
MAVLQLLSIFDSKLFISEERKRLVECKLGDWDFPAHDFSDDELVYGAYNDICDNKKKKEKR